MLKKVRLFLIAALSFPVIVFTQHPVHHTQTTLNNVINVEPQPLLAQALRLCEALTFLGSSLTPHDENRLKVLQNQPLSQQVVRDVQAIVDPYCLAILTINPESRV